MSRSGTDIDPRVLGLLLAAQSTISVFSVRQKMVEFVCRAVEGTPGVGYCAVCMPGAKRPLLGGEPIPECADCDVPEGDIDHNPGLPCRLAGCTGLRVFPIRTQDRLFGFCLLKVIEPERYAPYEPFITNIIDGLAVNVERQWQKDRLRVANDELLKHRNHLQELVGMRTAELAAANEALRVELSARKRAEEALKRSNEEFRSLFENTQIGMYRSKLDGSGFLDVNKKFSEIIGISREELIGSPGKIRWADPQERDRMLKLLKEQGGVLYGYETRVVAKNGDVRDVIASIVLRPDDGFLEGTMFDITERKRSEEALLLKNFVFDASIAAKSIANIDGVITEANDAFLRLWDFTSKEEVVGKPILDFLQNKEEAVAIITALNSTGTWEGDYTAKRKDGSTFIAHGLATVLRDKGGKLIGYQSAVLDITDRKRAENALRESEAKYRTLVENIPQGIFMKDTNFRWVSINERFARDLGIRPDDAVGKQDMDLFPKDLADKYRADDERILRSGKTEDIEEKTKLEGKEYWVHTIKTPVLDDNGVTIGVLGIFWDITERKKADAELASYRDHLEDLVRERTCELEAANRELESFAYSVSHDLRAPLRAMDGFSQALQEEYGDRLDDPGREYLEKVRSASMRMSLLIDDMLKLSKLTRSEMRREQVDLSALARMTLGEFGKSEPGRMVKVTVQDGLTVTGDPVLLQVAMENLLSNAWKFTSTTEAASIEFGARNENGKKTFFVRDNGAGFDQKYAGKLFGPFQRLHTSAEFPGTGIGLATVQRIIDRHGGRVWADAEPGKGATFCFTLE